MNKSAEALRVEAHRSCINRCDDRWTSEPWNTGGIGDRHDCTMIRQHRAIDLALAARALEVAEGMHEAGCDCRPAQPYVAGACTPYCDGPTDSIHQDQADPRCTEARARLRAEVERLSK